ncbi:MAG: hypothetical protein WCV90_04160 [Candidatus Woesearchaeota archaeon]
MVYCSAANLAYSGNGISMIFIGSMWMITLIITGYVILKINRGKR